MSDISLMLTTVIYPSDICWVVAGDIGWKNSFLMLITVTYMLIAVFRHAPQQLSKKNPSGYLISLCDGDMVADRKGEQQEDKQTQPFH